MSKDASSGKKTFKETLVASIVFTVIVIALLAETVSLSMTNNDLSTKLQDMTQTNEALKGNLESLQANYSALARSIGNGYPEPPIATRLGMKLDQATYADKVMLWVTGEVQNMGNRTLYNVRLRFDLNGGNESQDYVVGILEPYETVTVRTSIWSRFSADIVTWKMVPVATYTP